MEQTGLITNIIDENTARVSVLRLSACGSHCATCNAVCSSKQTMTVLADNKVSASPGDIVIIESGTKQVLGIAALVYLVPIILFFAGYACASLMALGEGVSIAAGFACFALSFAAVAAYSRTRGKRPVEFEITSIIDRGAGRAAGAFDG